MSSAGDSSRLEIADFRPGRIWSLWDAMNFELSTFCYLLKFLIDEERAPDFRLAPDPLPTNKLLAQALLGDLADVNIGSKKLAHSIVGALTVQCRLLEMEGTLAKLARFESALEYTLTPQDYRVHMQTIHETIEDELKRRSVYYIKRGKAEIVKQIPGDWKQTLSSFRKAEPEIKAAAMCYATDNSTAAVFHLMRVAELGLRGLARERAVVLDKNRPIEWADWEELLKAVRKKVDTLNGKPRGNARGRAVEFYSGVLGEFGAFKDVYRNNVMHMRVSYDENQAMSVMNHVREFMERLSGRVDENQKRQIAWGRMA
jgi:hypothetical protein